MLGPRGEGLQVEKAEDTVEIGELDRSLIQTAGLY